MNKYQKDVQKYTLEQERQILDRLKATYFDAKTDCEEKIRLLSARTDLQNMQSIIYQKQYQQMLDKQLTDVLDKLNKGTYDHIDEYLHDCYDTGYIGTMFDIMHQGVPITVPINQKQVVKAITQNTRLSSRMYSGDPLKGTLAENTNFLKEVIKGELSRGVANGSSWNQIAVEITKGMNNPFDVSFRRSVKIARTEGHRVQQSATYDAQVEAKNKGADVLKQWDSTLDNKTRPTHQALDGQIREIDEPFTNMYGEEAMFPSDFGIAAEDINCRCVCLERARWNLDEDELQKLKDRAEYFGLKKNDSFEDFKEKYLNLPDDANKIKLTEVLNNPVTSNDTYYSKVLSKMQTNNVDYNPVMNQTRQLTEEEIINALSGGDRTRGSCASVGLAYVGQKQGWDVLDFRDGISRSCFSRSSTLFELSHMDGVVATYYGDVAGKSSCTLANNFLKTCEEGKEYYLCVGRHAAIVRKNEGVLQYLELQSECNSGWTKFDGNARYTLTQRFGCSSSSGHGEKYDFMMNITDSNLNTDEVKSLLGFLNTAEGKQVKGLGGTTK